MSRKYPRFGEYRKLSKNTTSKCRARNCSNKATVTQFVQVSYMRGDDDGVRCCDECRRLPIEDFVKQFNPEDWK